MLENYASPEEKMRDRHFQQYKAKKYKGVDEMSTFDYQPSKPVSSHDVDKLEFKNIQEDFAKRHEMYHDIKGFENWGMAWDMNNAKDAKLKDYGALARGDMSLKEVQEKNEDRLNEIAMKRGLTRNDIDKWEQKKYKGLIWGLSDTMNDLRDSAVKSGLLTAGYVGVGAVGGAIVGLVAGGIPGAVVGAGYGAQLGLDAAAITAVPTGVFWDTAEKESASNFERFTNAKPHATASEFEQAKKESAINGLIDGAIEAGAAEYFKAYGLKISARIPALNKIAGKVTAEDEAQIVGSLKKAFSGEGGKVFIQSIGATMGVEFTQEEAQNLLDHVADYRMGILKKEDMTPQALADEALTTAGAIGQKTFLLAGLGAGADVRSRVNNTAEVLNQKIDQNNAEYEAPQEQAGKAGQKEGAFTKDSSGTFTMGIEKTDVVNMPEAELEQTHAAANTQVKQIDAKAKVIQAQIENAQDLGLEEKQVSTLEAELQKLQASKETTVNALREIGTERAIRQAKTETENNIEQVSTQIEQTHDTISTLETNIKQREADGKDTSSLLTKKTKLETKLSGLEEKHQGLLANKVQIDNRENIGEVLKNKTTTIPSTTLVNIEKNAKEAVAKTDAKAQIKVNKILEQHAKQKVNAAIKAAKTSQNSLVKGYQAGTKEQMEETRGVNKMLSKALISAGIKRSEMGAFDGIKSKIVHLSDLVANKKNIEAKIGQIFEARNKEHALKVTDKLKSLAKPFKGGKNPKGKMTPEVQAKVDRLFHFSEKSAFEAGFDSEELIQKFSDNQDAQLSNTEKARLVEAQNNATLQANHEEITRLKDTKQTPKTKWEGLNKEREDLVAPQKESIAENVKELKINKPDGYAPELAEKVQNEVCKTLSKALNIINMGFNFKNLTINIKESVFDKDNMDTNLGTYNIGEKTLNISKDSKFSIPHEIGHYFDNLLGEMVSGNEKVDFSEFRNFEDTTLKTTVKKLDVLMKAEAMRVREVVGYKDLTSEQQKYLTSNPEIFARIFNAMFNKSIGFRSKRSDFMSILTDDMPDKTISTFKTLLNDVANYKATGGRVFELQRMNEQLEADNKAVRTDAKEADRQAAIQNLPTSVAEVINELDLASDLKNRSSADIMRFNEYVAGLIQDGRDARALKEQARKEQLAKDTEAAIASVQGDAPVEVNKKYTEDEYAKKQEEVTKKSLIQWKDLSIKKMSQWLLNQAQRPTSTFSTLLDLIGQDDKTKGIEKLLDYIPCLRNFSEANQAQAKIFDDNMSETYNSKTERERENLLLEQSRVQDINNISYQDGTVGDLSLSKQQAMTLWGYLQNTNVRALLRKSNGFTTMFRPELGDEMNNETVFDEHRSIEAALENFLDPRDKEFVQKTMKQLDEFFPQVNEFYKEKYNINLGKIQNYLPLVREKTIGEAEDLMTNYQKGLFSSIPSAFSTRTRASKAIEFAPITQLVMDHFSDTLHYIHYNDLVTKGATIFSNRDFRDIVQEKYGNKIYDKLLETFKVVANPRSMQGIKSRINTLYRLYSSAAIGYNVRSGLKQALSFTNYATEVNPLSFSKGLADFMLSPQSMIKKTKFLFDNSPLLRARQNNINLEMSLLARDKKVIDMIKHKTWNRFQNHLYILSRYGDAFNVAMGGWAVYKSKLNEGLSHEDAIDFMDRQVYKYNQSANVEDLNTLQIHGGMGASFTMFRSDVLKLYNAQIATFRDYLRGNISAAETMKRTTFLTANNLMSLAVDTAFAPTRAEVMGVLMMGQLASLPVVGDFLQELMHMALVSLLGEDDDSKPLFGRESLMVDPTTNLAKVLIGTDKLAKKGDEAFEDWWKVYMAVGKPALQSIGIPSRAVESFHDFTNPDVDDDMLQRLPTLIWTRRTLKERQPELYSEE